MLLDIQQNAASALILMFGHLLSFDDRFTSRYLA